MTAKRKSKGAYMISSVAEMYGIHPQTLRLYEREGLLKPSRSYKRSVCGWMPYISATEEIM